MPTITGIVQVGERNRKGFLLPVLLLVLFNCQILRSYAQVEPKTPAKATVPSPKPTPERSREIVALLTDARYAAPELGVDIFLKVLESKKVTDPVWRKEILDEALQMADDVKNPVQLRPVAIKGVRLNNTEAYMIGGSHRQKLDHLSLKSRVITLLIDMDLARAKQLVFQLGGSLGLKPRTCADGVTYEVEDIYAAVVKVAKSAFTEKQVAEGQRALFVTPWLENIESPVQIVPALDLVEQLQGSATERQILFGSLSRAINRNFKDDRSFTSTISWYPQPAAKIGKLTAGEIDPLKTELIVAYRDFLLKNLRGTRCKDNEISKDPPLPAYVESANKLFPQKPLVFDDVATTDFAETGKFIDISARSPSIQKLSQELGPLKGAQADRSMVKVDQSNLEWQSKVAEFIDKIIAWEGTNGETSMDNFRVKTNFFLAMLESVDPGELRKMIVRKLLRQLAGAAEQKTNFIEWLVYAGMVRQSAADLFDELAPEFPNPNFKAMIAAKKAGLESGTKN